MDRSGPLPADFAEALAAARERLPPLGDPIWFFETIGSTNDVALRIAAEGCSDGTVILADAQTAGRGRYGRRWFSPPGSGLYVSVVLGLAASAVDPERATGLLTLAAGVALAEGIEAATGLRAVTIKWPNDLLVERRKLAGILAECAARDAASTQVTRRPPFATDRVVLGYGVNVSARVYPDELSGRVTSLESELGHPVDRVTIWIETLAALSQRYRDLLAGRFDAILDAWRQRSPASRGTRVTWATPAGARSGVTAGIDDHGALLVRRGDRIERIVGGEVTWA